MAQLNKIGPQEIQEADVVFEVGQDTFITVDIGKVSATLLRNGNPIQTFTIDAGSESTLHIPDDSSANDKYTIHVVGIANIGSEYRISGNATIV